MSMKPLLKHPCPCSDRIRIRDLSDDAMPDMKGIDLKVHPAVRSVSYRLFSRIYQGVGVVNQNNGIEFIDQDMTGFSVTLNNTGITFLPSRRGHRGDKLCVFLALSDYLAYQTLQRNGYVRLPSDCDAVIMSDVRNFVHAAIEGDDYDRVYLYFPNDIIGHTITRTLKERYGDYAIVCNPLYKGYDNLLQFARAIEQTTNNK